MKNLTNYQIGILRDEIKRQISDYNNSIKNINEIKEEIYNELYNSYEKDINRLNEIEKTIDLLKKEKQKLIKSLSDQFNLGHYYGLKGDGNFIRNSDMFKNKVKELIQQYGLISISDKEIETQIVLSGNSNLGAIVENIVKSLTNGTTT